jgi:parallel beta-helix repeat protein
MWKLTRQARPPLDVPIEVLANVAFDGIGEKAQPVVGAAMVLLAQALDRDSFIRLTVTEQGFTQEWRRDFGWWPGREFDRSEGISILAVLKAFGGILPDGDAPESARSWPAGHFKIRYRDKTRFGIVQARSIPIGAEVIVAWDDDGLALAWAQASERERDRILKDFDRCLRLEKLGRCEGPVVRPGSEVYPTIRSALESAGPGARIVVKPGTYEEELWISKHVQLLGEGADQVRVVSTRDPCLRLTAAGATIYGIGFELARVEGAKPMYAVAVTKGGSVLDSCEMTSATAACVAVRGSEACPTLRRCKIPGGGETGLFVYQQATPRVEDCEITGNARDGIRITTGGSPTVSGCRIGENGRYGVRADADCSGLIERCDLRGNGAGAWGLPPGHAVRGSDNVI